MINTNNSLTTSFVDSPPYEKTGLNDKYDYFNVLIENMPSNPLLSNDAVPSIFSGRSLMIDNDDFCWNEVDIDDDSRFPINNITQNRGLCASDFQPPHTDDSLYKALKHLSNSFEALHQAYFERTGIVLSYQNPDREHLLSSIFDCEETDPGRPVNDYIYILKGCFGSSCLTSRAHDIRRIHPDNYHVEYHVQEVDLITLFAAFTMAIVFAMGMLSLFFLVADLLTELILRQRFPNQIEGLNEAHRSRRQGLPNFEHFLQYTGKKISSQAEEAISTLSLEELRDSGDEQYLKIGDNIFEYQLLKKWVSRQHGEPKDIITDVKLYFITQQAYEDLSSQDKTKISRGEKLIYRDNSEYKVGLVPLRFGTSQIDWNDQD